MKKKGRKRSIDDPVLRSCYLTGMLDHRLQTLAVKQHKSVSQVIRDAVTEHVRNNNLLHPIAPVMDDNNEPFIPVPISLEEAIKG